MEWDLVLPVLLIGLFFAVVLGLMLWFFGVMIRSDSKARRTEGKIRRSRFVRRMLKRRRVGKWMGNDFRGLGGR